MAFEGIKTQLIQERENFKKSITQTLDSIIGEYSIITSNIGAGDLIQIKQELLEVNPNFFNSSCPTQNEKLRIIKVLQNVLKNLQTVNNKILPAKKLITTIQTLITSSNVVLTGLKLSPIPGVSSTAGLVITLTDIFDNIKDLVKTLEGDLITFKRLVESYEAIEKDIQTKVILIDRLLQICSEDITQYNSPEELQQFLIEVKDVNNLKENYKGFLIEVRQENTQTPTTVKRNFAVALDGTGAVVYKGPSSFSASTDILIEEVKFYLDQLLTQ